MRRVLERRVSEQNHVRDLRLGPEAPISERTLFGAPVVVLRSSGVLARCSARARRVTPYGPLEGPKTFKLPADKGPLCLQPRARTARRTNPPPQDVECPL